MYTVKLLKNKGYNGIPKRIFSEIQKRVMLTFPLAWNLLFKAGHFGDEAEDKYKYAPRAGERKGGLPQKGSYTAKKLRLYGHTRALEFTGRGKAEALANNLASSGRTHSGELWALARLPRIFNLRNPQGRTNPAKEITTVLKTENTALDALSQQKLNAEILRRADHQGYIS
jgi:hypothetical protein